jgi:hypothetical protein
MSHCRRNDRHLHRPSQLLSAALLAAAFAAPAAAQDTDPKAMLKAMSDYVGGQKDIAFKYDSTLQVVTTDFQKLAFISSGTTRISRPDRLRVTRTGGFSDIEFVYDGKTVTLAGKNKNVYAVAPVEAKSIDDLIGRLHDDYNIEAPGADLLLANIYDELVGPVTDAKDLGVGVIDGKGCEHLAFRTSTVDWEIWIAADGPPIPCRYVVTSKLSAQAPQYTLEINSWQDGAAVVADDFTFKNASGASKIAVTDLKDIDELPGAPQ